MTDTPDRRVTPADTDPVLASQCLRMARFIDDQEAVLDFSLRPGPDPAFRPETRP